MSSFCSAKATHIFSAKNIRILYIEFSKIVKEMTLTSLLSKRCFEQLGPDQQLFEISEVEIKKVDHMLNFL